jgi:hypothetical protein
VLGADQKGDRAVRAFAAAALTASLVLSAGCGGGDDGPRAGTVVGHRYDDPDTTFIPGVHIPGSCSTYNGYTTCTPGYSTPAQWINDREHYYLVLDDGTDTGKVEVDAYTYHNVEDGDFYDHEVGL